MENCVFCAICAGNLPSAKLYEDAKFIAILNRYPATQGHALILPKRHTSDFFGLTDSECASLGSVAKYVGLQIMESLKPEGLNLLQNNGTAAGQEIFHFHLHLIPRYGGDEVSVRMPQIQVSSRDLDEIAARIRDA